MNPWYSLENKTIWVTGGAGYFGGAITKELDPLCRKVICLDRPGRAEAFVAEEKLTRTIPVSQDLADVAVIPGLVEKLVAAHGVPDGLVNLTFASFGAGKGLAELPLTDFQKTVNDGVAPTFLLCRELAERMRPRGSGSFVIYASMYGVVAPNPKNYPAPMAPNSIDYGASKAALLQMSRYFAVHYGPAGLRFNCLTPGAFPHPPLVAAEPEFIARLSASAPLGRIGRRNEMVGPSPFLLSDGASYVTGHNLVVDGGWTAW